MLIRKVFKPREKRKTKDEVRSQVTSTPNRTGEIGLETSVDSMQQLEQSILQHFHPPEANECPAGLKSQFTLNPCIAETSCSAGKCKRNLCVQAPKTCDAECPTTSQAAPPTLSHLNKLLDKMNTALAAVKSIESPVALEHCPRHVCDGTFGHLDVCSDGRPKCALDTRSSSSCPGTPRPKSPCPQTGRSRSPCPVYIPRPVSKPCKHPCSEAGQCNEAPQSSITTTLRDIVNRIASTFSGSSHPEESCNPNTCPSMVHRRNVRFTGTSPPCASSVEELYFNKDLKKSDASVTCDLCHSHKNCKAGSSSPRRQLPPLCIEFPPSCSERRSPRLEPCAPCLEPDLPCIEPMPPCLELITPCMKPVPPCMESAPPCMESAPPCMESVPPCMESAPPCMKPVPPCMELAPSCMEPDPPCTEPSPCKPASPRKNDDCDSSCGVSSIADVGNLCDAAQAQYYHNKLLATQQVLANKEKTVRVQAESLAMAEDRITSLTARAAQARAELERCQKELKKAKKAVCSSSTCTQPPPAEVENRKNMVVTLQNNLSVIEDLYRECFYETAKQEELIEKLRKSYLDVRLMEKEKADQVGRLQNVVNTQRWSLDRCQDLAEEVDNLKLEISNFLNSSNYDSGMWEQTVAGEVGDDLQDIMQLLHVLRDLLQGECVEPCIEYQEENEKLKQLNKDLEGQLADSRQRVCGLECSLLEKDAVISRYKSNNDEVHDQMQCLQQEMQSLQKVEQEKCREVECLKTRIREMEEALDERRAELENTQAHCTELENCNRELRQELDKADAIIKEWAYSGLQHQNGVNQWDTKRNDSSQSSVIITQNCRIRSEVSYLSSQVALWRRQLAESEARVRGVEDELARMRTHCRDVDNCYREKATAAAALETQLEEAHARGAELCAEARRVVCTVRHWVRRMQATNADNERKIKEQDKVIDNLQKVLEDRPISPRRPSQQSSPCGARNFTNDDPCCSFMVQADQIGPFGAIGCSKCAAKITNRSGSPTNRSEGEPNSERTGCMCRRAVEVVRQQVTPRTCGSERVTCSSGPTPPHRLLRKKVCTDRMSQYVCFTDNSVQRPVRVEAATSPVPSRRPARPAPAPPAPAPENSTIPVPKQPKPRLQPAVITKQDKSKDAAPRSKRNEAPQRSPVPSSNVPDRGAVLPRGQAPRRPRRRPTPVVPNESKPAPVIAPPPKPTPVKTPPKPVVPHKPTPTPAKPPPKPKREERVIKRPIPVLPQKPVIPPAKRPPPKPKPIEYIKPPPVPKVPAKPPAKPFPPPKPKPIERVKKRPMPQKPVAKLVKPSPPQKPPTARSAEHIRSSPLVLHDNVAPVILCNSSVERDGDWWSSFVTNCQAGGMPMMQSSSCNWSTDGIGGQPLPLIPRQASEAPVIQSTPWGYSANVGRSSPFVEQAQIDPLFRFRTYTDY